MTPRVAHIFRYPIKSLGREALDTATLTPGQTLPWDRAWAVMHAHSKTDGTEWARCMNFLRVASSPALAAVWAELEETTATITLRHKDHPDLVVRPDADPQAIVDWVAPLVAEGRAAPTGIARADRGMTDTDFPSISIANLASHKAVAQKLGTDLSIHRWRSNIFLEGLAPWEELEWEGRTLKIGAAQFKIEARIARCQNVQANPETGRRDQDVLGALDHWGHQDFSMAAVVTQGGTITIGDTVALL